MSLVTLVLLASCLAMTHGYHCEWPGAKQPDNIFDQIVSNCPGLADSSDKQYCCTNERGEFHCCNLLEFAITYIIIGVALIAIISIACCIVSCLCCPCCCLYKRRHGSIHSVPAYVTLVTPGPVIQPLPGRDIV